MSVTRGISNIAKRGLHTSPATALQATKAATQVATGSYVEGTVNDPTRFPPPNSAHGSSHWAFERAVSAALVPVIGASFITSSHPVIDGLICSSLLVHSHIGFDASLTDYLHDRKFPKIGPIARWSVRGLTLGAAIGLYSFQTNDIGVTELVAKLWTA
ncbi:hypothetical protein E3Q22_02717 [Wallemia mellicola]|uniref:Succinate dehydrogenase [ubiquinone] cytochrome b small subunit n=2 Tax=Wallemia mellicola TaxID=1708541 RepID=A0A4T0S0A5_9BASI|nr:hypothetical protein WALSEDRAFT_70583 [Wallemia mellicola CBS 633.66]TIB71471.1 hypothetical protein E3Q24_02288 [Wallemia mellicola]EIM19460.1 hypothetical protein WALSEDRAFT_70583 [Wallemia mellicola CBS 633.66]TIB75413.1 hypothetical protein E3Q23_02420 [Wallemia mellicola]TIB78171.1 hypothetical protein E3Q22_02717 [Wallemia mellicola]TIB90961.1 hypothetical protein E3Q21_00147 [Wallemia mellicola]|eukprot:XP_006960492.1 hypothetical protein WALSEDRAFT_70583 [Wallemia mellicola CBS 633.66]